MPRGRGYTKVDLKHLLEDLRDAYPGGLEETILTELVANSLDAGATVIRMVADPASATFRLEDDGSGMVWKDLRAFHNLAASSKTRGQGIGFAGVGIKLSLLAAREVVTESRRGRSHAASRWHLASREFAPYEPVAPPGHVGEHGTAVSLLLHHGLSPLLDVGFLEHVVRQHFEPLLIQEFQSALARHYPKGVRFEVNGRPMAHHDEPKADHAAIEVRVNRQRKPSGMGFVRRHPFPVPEHARGIAISTFGKVIRRGWDWLGLLPAAPDRITGLIEVPALSESLTLNKGDFVRTGPRGGVYLTYRRAMQEAVQAQLAQWGDLRDVAQEERRRVARPLERDLERVLEGLTDAFPLLASLVERHRGGQKRFVLDPNGRDGTGGHGEAPAALATPIPSSAGDERVPPAADALLAEAPLPEAGSRPPAPVVAESDGGATARATRAQRYGLSLQFEARPDDTEIARLIENTVWINTAHAAYRRAESTRSTGYHNAVATALAIAPLATGGSGVQEFLTAFLGHWGESVGTPKARKRSTFTR